MDGSGSGTVIEPLLALEREDLTGALEFRANGVSTVIFARAGEIGFASGGALGETLGRLLVRTGRLDEDFGVSIIHHMIDRLVDREETQMGGVLVDYGFLTPAELDLALTQQVREKLIGCILRGRGEWIFRPDDPRLEQVGSYVVGVRPTLMEAARRFSERRVEEILSLSTPRFPEIVAPESVVATEFELSPEETALLRELDGTVSISFLRSKAGAAQLLPLLAALALGGGITLRVTPTTSRRPSESRSIPPAFRTNRRGTVDNPQEVASQAERDDSTIALDAPTVGRGIPRMPESASTIAVVRSTRDHRPSRESFDIVAPDAAGRGREAYARLKVQLDNRKPKAGRRRWPDAKNDRERRLMAASAFHKGRVFLRGEEAERALPGLHRALELRPQELEYELYVKWAQLLVNDAFKDDARRNEVEHLAIKCVRADHLCELAWSVLGHVAHHDGNDEAALRFFQRALKLDPRLVDAGRLVGLLANRQSSEPHIRASIADATERARRGALQTPLDELVPVRNIPERQSERRLPKPPAPRARLAPGQLTPRGGLIVDNFGEPVALAPPLPPPVGMPLTLPIAMPVPALPAVQPKATPSPAPAEVSPPPSERTLALAPTARAPLTPPPARPPSVRPPPAQAGALPPPSVPPPRISDDSPVEGTAIMPPLAARQPPPVASVPPAAPAPMPPLAAVPSRPVSLPDDLPTGRPKRSGVLLMLVGVVALGTAAAVAVFYVRGTKPSSPPVTSATTAASATTAPRPTPTPSAAPPPSASVVTSAIPVSPASASAASTPSAAPSASVSAAPSASAEGADPNATTGILHAKNLGHRVFFDGRVVGEAGRDLTVPCGAHKVKVGSAGVERALTVPCGGRLDVD